MSWCRRQSVSWSTGLTYPSAERRWGRSPRGGRRWRWLVAGGPGVPVKQFGSAAEAFTERSRVARMCSPSAWPGLLPPVRSSSSSAPVVLRLSGEGECVSTRWQRAHSHSGVKILNSPTGQVAEGGVLPPVGRARSHAGSVYRPPQATPRSSVRTGASDQHRWTTPSACGQNRLPAWRSCKSDPAYSS